MSLSWQAPDSGGGAAITGYRVYQGAGNKLVASATGTSAAVKNLVNGTAYSFTVTAVNKAGEGPASGSVSATPTAPVSKTGSPNGPAASPGNGQVVPSGEASATPTAGAPASASVPASASPDGGPTGPGTPGAAGGPAATPGNAEASLASATGKLPKPVVVSLAAAVVAASAAAAALTARRLRMRRRRRPPAAPPADVRAVPEPGPPSHVSLHEIGLVETYVVRLEPLPAAVITTIEELETTS